MDKLGLPIDEIGRAYHETWLRSCSVKEPGRSGGPKRTLSPVQLDMVRYWRGRGHGWAKIGLRVGLACHTVRRIANENDIS